MIPQDTEKTEQAERDTFTLVDTLWEHSREILRYHLHDEEIDIVGPHFRSAFAHGYKHGRE
jgi:hypothetical protein